MFRIFTTKEFDEDFNKLDGSDKKRVLKIRGQLEKQGSDVGKPLGRPYFREKRFEGKRLYFLVYKEFMIILAIAVSDKKMQQATIDNVIAEIKSYEEYIVKRLKEVSN